jgi:hypothetical protein
VSHQLPDQPKESVEPARHVNDVGRDVIGLLYFSVPPFFDPISVDLNYVRTLSKTSVAGPITRQSDLKITPLLSAGVVGTEQVLQGREWLISAFVFPYYRFVAITACRTMLTSSIVTDPAWDGKEQLIFHQFNRIQNVFRDNNYVHIDAARLAGLSGALGTFFILSQKRMHRRRDWR